MKNHLLLFVGAAALSLTSCSQEKTADTTTTTTTDATMAMPDTAAYRTRSQQIADKYASDMKITDEATRAKLRTAYYNRSKRYGEMKSRYASDTTGMAAAMRQYNTDTDTEFQGVLTDPAQYQSYQSSRSTYDEANYLDNTNAGAAASSATMPDNNASTTNADATSASTDMSSTEGVGIEKSKTKLQDGAQIKIKDDGTVKTKTADGDKNAPITSDAPLKYSKTKMDDGSKVKVKDDGTVKLKDSDGSKTKL